jgi:glyoxylase-like metal-dependent hydrolase (beta-lactamase superfamily II)
LVLRDIGEVVPGLHVLATSQTPSYLLDAHRPVLFDGGMSFLGPSYISHARRVLGGRSPEFLLLSHVHFDHCGATSQLRGAFPGLRVGASAPAVEILARPRALELIHSLNEEARELAPALGLPCPEGAVFRPFEVDIVLGDGDTLDLGRGTTLQVLATPGHTRDFLSYHVPELGLLVASEAGGCAHWSGPIVAEFVSDYDAYVASLRRLLDLDARVLCQGHCLVYTGRDVRAFLEASLREAETFQERVASLLDEEGGDIAAVVERVKSSQYDPLPAPRQPERAYLLNTEARVRHLAGRSP